MNGHHQSTEFRLLSVGYYHYTVSPEFRRTERSLITEHKVVDQYLGTKGMVCQLAVALCCLGYFYLVLSPRYFGLISQV